MVMSEQDKLNLEQKINYMVNWFVGRQNTTFYSQELRLGQIQNNKYGFDCSSALYFALIDSGLLPRGTTIGWTATLMNDLPKIADRITEEECNRGDIFLCNPYSGEGHCGVFMDKNNIISMQWGSNGTIEGGSGIKIQHKSWMGSQPRTFWRIKGSTGDINKDNTFPSTTTNNSNYLLFVSNVIKFFERKIKLPKIKDELINIICEILEIKKEELEPQLLYNEFCEVVLYDGYGNNYSFNPFLIPEKENNLLINGSISDSNQVHYTIEGYGIKEQNIESVKFQYGIMDNVPKSLTVISDNVETLFQSKKNQIEAQQKSFNENKNMLSKQIKLNNSQTNLANAESSYNLQYSVDSANIGMLKTGINSLANVAGSMLISPAMALGATVNAGFNMYDSYRNLGNAKQQQEFGEKRNSLRTQSNALNAMNAKQSLKQSERAFNASIKDVENQPDTISNMGNDLSFQGGHNLDNLYLDYRLPSKFILKTAHNYIKQNGVNLNIWLEDIRKIFEQRKNYNYIQSPVIFTNNLEINQSHRNALEMVFATGIQIFNYNENIYENYYNESVNEDG